MCFGVARWSLGGARVPRGLPGGCPMVIGLTLTHLSIVDNLDGDY